MALVGAIGAVQYQQQGAIGKYNQAVANRNAQVAEQEAQRLEQQLEFDLARFCLLYTSPSPRDLSTSRMPSSA